jgi:hypothetical protein
MGFAQLPRRASRERNKSPAAGAFGDQEGDDMVVGGFNRRRTVEAEASVSLCVLNGGLRPLWWTSATLNGCSGSSQQTAISGYGTHLPWHTQPDDVMAARMNVHLAG